MFWSFPAHRLMPCVAAGGSEDTEYQSMPSFDEAAGVSGAAHDLGLARATIKHSRAARLCHEAGNGADTQ